MRAHRVYLAFEPASTFRAALASVAGTVELVNARRESARFGRSRTRPAGRSGAVSASETRNSHQVVASPSVRANRIIALDPARKSSPR